MWMRVCNQRPSNCDDEKTSKQLPDDNDFALCFFTPFQDMCGFDYNLCGFQNSVTHKGQWIRERATEEEVDHTSGTDNGQFKMNCHHCLTILKKIIAGYDKRWT